MAIYNKKQYIRIDKTVEEISKIKIKFSHHDKDRIEDLGLEGDENVLIYENRNVDGEEFINIFSGVRIMITTYLTINKDKYRKLPKNIEYVIVDEIIYDVRDEFNMIHFMSEERFKEYIEEEIRKGRINESNKNGETALYWACKKKMEEKALELIPRMTEEAINKWDKYGITALHLACSHGMEKVALELIPRTTEEAINHLVINDCGEHLSTSLNWACYHNMEKVALELIPRMTEETINKWDDYGQTALHLACSNGMEKVALELISRMSEEAVTKKDYYGKKAIDWACRNKMEEVVVNEMEIIYKNGKL